jgi:hypothetical protein
MNKRTEEALLANGKTVEADNAQEIEEGMLNPQLSGTAVH